MSPALALVGQYWHTLRHLRPVQLYGLARNRIVGALPFRLSAEKRGALARCIRPPVRCFLPTPESLRGATLTFLNHSIDYSPGHTWHDHKQSKLWRYHLHYMAFLRQKSAGPACRGRWMRDWVLSNSDPGGEGWEPYPTSLRLTNWFKVWWEDGFLEGDAPLLASAYAQARHLRRHVECHLQGNHLFENLKALFWAGCMFSGEEAKHWRIWAARGLGQQLLEQVLSDGGHYERSPMYHSLVLEGCLDLLNIKDSWEDEHPDLHGLLATKSEAMLRWLDAMTHPDGEIALFNDAAWNIAPPPTLLFEYGKQLGVAWRSPDALSHLNDSGYVAIHDLHHYVAIDVGPIGPDHQPGHGHCDLLSFEWSVGDQRIICDSGVYAYQDASMRPYVRSTAAHNTIQIDRADQSEVWREFRVARRARPCKASLAVDADGTLRVEAAHDGYCRLPGRPVHERQFMYHNGELVLRDRVTGAGVHEIVAFLHFHPAVTVKPSGEHLVDIHQADRKLGTVSVEHWQESMLLQGWYCPEFGMRQRNAVLALRSKVRLPFVGETEICLRQAVA